jgi:hypothetical protein
MMFHVGQKVVCVEDGTDSLTRFRKWLHPYPPCIEPIRGRIYTICNIRWREDVPNRPYTIELLEAPSPADNYWSAGWDSECFRPLTKRKTDISIFKKILDDAQK